MRAVTSLLYMGVDAKNSYDRYCSEIDKQYIEDNWELDDEETENLSESRKNLVDYMYDMCQQYGLDGMKTLTEETAKEFAEGNLFSYL